jgi:hypothetical protein
MRRMLLRSAAWAALAGIAGLAVAIVRTGDRELALDAYLLFLGALALRVLVRATQLAVPAASSSRFESALRPVMTRPQRPEGLESLERAVLLATETAGDWHVRLRPTLREIAEHRLSTRRGLDLHAPAAPTLLGEAWPLVRPDAAAPAARFEKGLPVDDLRAAVAELERI